MFSPVPPGRPACMMPSPHAPTTCCGRGRTAAQHPAAPSSTQQWRAGQCGRVGGWTGGTPKAGWTLLLLSIFLCAPLHCTAYPAAREGCMRRWRCRLQCPKARCAKAGTRTFHFAPNPKRMADRTIVVCPWQARIQASPFPPWLVTPPHQHAHTHTHCPTPHSELTPHASSSPRPLLRSASISRRMA